MGTVQDRYKELAASAEQIRREKFENAPILIQVGSATCEHAAGSREVLDEFRKHVAASGRDDIILHQTGCTG
ncbi:MAG: NADH-quinone oxidoreductase subunit E, partial [Planctomycetota bacterium]|nr:NADH-quinone oxidoreductase subunit E [Planctomycetota bacterium]